MDDHYKGFVKVYRSLRQHPIWKGEKFTKGQAWVDLLLRASWSESKVIDGMNWVEVEPGDIIVSLRKLADTWGWSRNKVKRFLELLENDTMIETISRPTHTCVKVLNWKRLQQSANGSGPINGPTNETQTRRKRDANETGVDPIKEEQEGEEGQEEDLLGDSAEPPSKKSSTNGKPVLRWTRAELYQDTFADIWELWPKKVGKKKAAQTFWRIVQKDEATPTDIRQGVENFKAHRLPEIEDDQYIPHMTTWLNRGGWEDEYSMTERQRLVEEGRKALMKLYGDEEEDE